MPGFPSALRFSPAGKKKKNENNKKKIFKKRHTAGRLTSALCSVLSPCRLVFRWSARKLEIKNPARGRRSALNPLFSAVEACESVRDGDVVQRSAARRQPEEVAANEGVFLGLGTPSPGPAGSGRRPSAPLRALPTSDRRRCYLLPFLLTLHLEKKNVSADRFSECRWYLAGILPVLPSVGHAPALSCRLGDAPEAVYFALLPQSCAHSSDGNAWPSAEISASFGEQSERKLSFHLRLREPRSPLNVKAETNLARGSADRPLPALVFPAEIAKELTDAESSDLVGQLVFRATNSTAVIDRLAGHLGTARGTQETRDQLHGSCFAETEPCALLQARSHGVHALRRQTDDGAHQSLTVLVNEPGADNVGRLSSQPERCCRLNTAGLKGFPFPTASPTFRTIPDLVSAATKNGTAETITRLSAHGRAVPDRTTPVSREDQAVRRGVQGACSQE
ncbi:MAG: hypothetical protein BJ554DRAFT_3346 [Olpidium bornovanus]|uniref:Uncharacterized protein n=1 Tax=Olpidium bornovanus TaxID=278681 RepID=A0A8H8DLK1_9FUNG|nr:MAG: hypothetical protein BJ554DRAFT_3346 [Olpidium bornovanus]